MSNERRLAIYLNDHLAGSIVGFELATRAANNNKGTPLGTLLNELAREIEQDRRTLEELMSELGIQRNAVKGGVAWVAEKMGRLKLNGQLSGYSDLSRLEELEWLSLGVEGKLAMWRNLITVRKKYTALDKANLEDLVARAEAQRTKLERARQEAAIEAL